jgi:hypothetical protein
MADDYGSLLDQIADESRRPRATFGVQIAACVQEAIDTYAKQRFWWNQSLSETFVTVAAQEYYGASDNAKIPYVVEFDSVKATIASTNKPTLQKWDWQTLENWNSDGASTGQPTDYAYYAQQIRLYPIPDAVYTITMSGLFLLTRLSADADTNAWVTRGQGEKLIRCHASALFYGTYLRQTERAAQFMALANQESSDLTASLSRRQATGRIQASL